MGEEEGKDKFDVVSKEEYNKIVELQNITKVENERISKELNEMKSKNEELSKLEDSWKEAQKTNEAFQQEVKTKMEALDKETIIRKGIVPPNDKHLEGNIPKQNNNDDSNIKIVSEHFKEVLEADKVPKEGSLAAYGYSKNEATVGQLDQKYGDALVLGTHAPINIAAAKTKGDIIVNRN